MDTYENKYKEALAHAREIHRNEKEKRRDMEFIFPELAESEDEKIRKCIIELVKYVKGGGLQLLDKPFNDVPMDTMLAWLEKQGEKLPVGFYYVNSEGKKFYSDTFKYGDVTLHIEKQGEQKPFDYENANIQRKDFAPKEEPKQEWSEEDESILSDIVNHFDGFPLKHQTHEIFGWLVSLKQRCK